MSSSTAEHEPARAAIGDAIAIAERHGATDGAHHKQWVIDQMLRALTGVDYQDWRAAYEVDGDQWDEGTAP
jgi:hypothetical protein